MVERKPVRLTNADKLGQIMSEPRFSVVIPCYNEEGAIAATIDGLRENLADAGPHEIIVVDDGSTDGSRDILAALVAGHQDLRVVSHDRNRGYGAALKTGIRRAISDVIVITDADGTYPNARIPELVNIAQEADMVVGSRTGEKVTYSRIRRIPILFLGWYSSWIANQHIPDINSGLRVFRKSIAEKFLNILPDGFSFTMTITLAMLTNYYDVRFVDIDYSPRVGKSKIRPIRDTLQFVQLIVRTGTYFAPLRVFFPLIAMLSLAFLASLAYDVFVARNLTDKTVILLMFSINTTMFGLLADMIDKRTSR